MRARVLERPAADLFRQIFAGLVVVAVAGATYARLYFGVDFTDESFYTAVPYRFVRGARPLIDETIVNQLTPGVLLYPFVKAYLAIKGLDGLILYARHLHFLFCVGVALVVSVTLRRALRDGAISALIAATAIAFVPFGIHGLSYNTFGSGFLTIGCFLGFDWSSRGGTIRLVLCGCAQALAIFAYPPLIIPVACFFALLFVAAKPRSRSDIVAGVAPVIAGVAATAAFFLQDGLGTARTRFREASAGGQGGGIGKAVHILHSVFSAYPHKAIAAALLIVAAIGLRRVPVLRWALALLPLTAIPTDRATAASATAFVTSFGLLAPFVFPLARRNAAPIATSLFVVVWMPSAIAGWVTAFSSYNGSINFAIGFFPGMVATIALIALGLMPYERTAAPVAATIALAIGIAIQYSFVYRDAPMSLLSTRIRGGAYAGLHTTPARVAFLEQLNAGLAEVSGGDCTILFFDEFPGGYLLGHGRPSANSAFIGDITGNAEAPYERLLLSYYAANGGLPDVAVRIKSIPTGTSQIDSRTYRPSDPLERTMHSNYRLAAATRYFDVRTRIGSTCRR